MEEIIKWLRLWKGSCSRDHRLSLCIPYCTQVSDIYPSCPCKHDISSSTVSTSRRYPISNLISEFDSILNSAHTFSCRSYSSLYLRMLNPTFAIMTVHGMACSLKGTCQFLFCMLQKALGKADRDLHSMWEETICEQVTGLLPNKLSETSKEIKVQTHNSTKTHVLRIMSVKIQLLIHTLPIFYHLRTL